MTSPAVDPIRVLRGRARRLGDGVNTDHIIASSRKKETLDPARLGQWLLEGVDPAFAASVRPGDILVAGDAFGCGSAMEVAVTVVLAAGIRAVLARSFSRTYFRNAVNNGLIPIECETARIGEGDALEIRIGAADIRVVVTPAARADREPPDAAAGGRAPAPAGPARRPEDRAAGAGRFELAGRALPPFILGILEAGGLVSYLRERGGFPEAGS